MTGRRLYDHYCDAAKKNTKYSWDHDSTCASTEHPAKSWSFLSDRDKKVWNAMAARITPKPRKATA